MAKKKPQLKRRGARSISSKKGKRKKLAKSKLITGLVFGTIFAATGQIWMVMCAHAAFDLAAIAIIYWNLEAAVAHLVFK